ncbi:metal ABC transporter solute-binding protein, Zn/Mn family [Cellulomonas citrea]|uniref:metal ABC transporter solute-binding protein, Zn/Mn family n=1 Tax=Cellulomonas citrea TaxID=1909423 RepID=UPI0013574BF2|nr:zinc ABC transporter substrate-binding protein [Cellulomonas citrea]
MSSLLRRLPLVAVPLAVLLTAGCSSSSSTAGSSASASAPAGAVVVVASTNVWGDVVQQVGGDLVDVTSLMTDPNADPHSFEANAQSQLAVSKASLVVENGGGYDDYMDTMLSSLSSKPAVINAVDVSGKTAPAGGELNEHVWYDFATVTKVADTIATQLSTVDPSHADTYAANAKTFDAKVATLTQSTADLKTTVAGKGVAITEPVPGYLLGNLGLVNKTPAEFSEAIENETDVPATVLSDTLALFSSHEVAALVYNEQTTGPQTEQVLAAAKAAGVAVVPVTETLPAGKDYITWMTANLDALRTALTA